MILRQFLHADSVGLFERRNNIPPAPPEAAKLRAANSGRTDMAG
jgi:hypothetical protein